MTKKQYKECSATLQALRILVGEDSPIAKVIVQVLCSVTIDDDASEEISSSVLQEQWETTGEVVLWKKTGLAVGTAYCKKDAENFSAYHNEQAREIERLRDALTRIYNGDTMHERKLQEIAYELLKGGAE